jgi:2-polyprenyl-3-methyl-5-hydroxy-6-metoxy-1,4-benzoquinol methylase
MDDPSYFDRQYFQLHPGKVRYLDSLIALLRRHGVTDGPVLDVGSGYGFFLEALERAGYQPYGLEVSPHANEMARSRTSATLLTQSAEEPFRLPADTFHAVTLLDVIEHLADYPATLAECRRVLAPGGRLFVLTLNAHSVARPLLGRHWSWHQDPTHLHLFSPARLRSALAAAGLTPRRVITLFNFCSVGETTPWLKPLQRIGRVIRVPWLGDSVLAVGVRDAYPPAASVPPDPPHRQRGVGAPGRAE